jgi:hypothetical protein
MKISNEMTMEEIITALAEEYGEDFNWSLIPETNNYYITELKKELGADNPLFQNSIRAIAKCESNDDVLYVLNDDMLRIYHLTYSANNFEGYPKYKEFSSVKAAAEYIQDKFVKEFL